MRIPALVLAALIALPAVARAQASVDIQFGLPVVLPPLVVVSPGIQVVPGVQEEVFFVDGFYWVRRDRVWYRSRSHTGGWAIMPGRGVPPGLARIPPGRYKNWKGGPAPYRGGPAPYRGGPARYRGGPAAYRGGPAAAYRGGPGGHDRVKHKGHERH